MSLHDVTPKEANVQGLYNLLVEIKNDLSEVRERLVVIETKESLQHTSQLKETDILDTLAKEVNKLSKDQAVLRTEIRVGIAATATIIVPLIMFVTESLFPL
tara:strand:- start:7437 stop:7742 length:306 start_codon:yes stop_codon:yes gene_type:complete